MSSRVMLEVAPVHRICPNHQPFLGPFQFPVHPGEPRAYQRKLNTSTPSKELLDALPVLAIRGGRKSTHFVAYLVANF